MYTPGSMSRPRQKAFGGLFKNGKYECFLLSPARVKAECEQSRVLRLWMSWVSFARSFLFSWKSSLLMVRRVVLMETHYLWISAKGDPGGGGWSASWSEPLITGACCGQVAPDIRGKNGALVLAGFLETKAGFPKNDDGAQRQRPLPGLSTAQSGTLFCLFSGMLGYSPASEMLWTVGEIRRVEMNIQCHHQHP